MYPTSQPVAKHKLIYILVSGHISTGAVAQSQPSLEVTATGSQESIQSILTPNKIVQGDELLNKLGTTLGATIANELGVSATGYGAGSSRPVIRGLEGPRVQILQNGLSVGDVSRKTMLLATICKMLAKSKSCAVPQLYSMVQAQVVA
jgi:iron complex outermembrane receptor protein